MSAEKQTHKVGTYAELRPVVDSEHLPFCIPSLVSTLLRNEQQKGSALTEEEAVRIRDAATAILLKKGTETPIIDGRGYDDIDAEKVWPEWQKARRQFKKPNEANKPAQLRGAALPSVSDLKR